MYYQGVDIGASAVKLVLLSHDASVVGRAMADSGYGAPETARLLGRELILRHGLNASDVGYTVATGYGRVRFDSADEEVSEITCMARGASHLYADARTIIDIGGQDSKAVSLLPGGQVRDFAMNDRCAAGTGRFLEVMARIVGTGVEELGSLAQRSTTPVTISSTCTVFAESEVISQISSGASREDIIAGLHIAIANRVLGMAARVGLAARVVLTGGVANNEGLVQTLAGRAGVDVSVPDGPEYVTALGAALIAHSRIQPTVRP